MKKLKQIIDCSYDTLISGITDDSRDVYDGYLFVATKGFNVDHFDYIEKAIENGAVAIISDRNVEVDIYGLNFEMNISEIESVENNKDNMSIDEQIERILGKNAIEKINNKRLKDGYEELNANAKTTILGFIIETYTRVLSDNMINSVTNVVGDIDKHMKDFTNSNFNRVQRRYNERYNRNHRRY